jgi:hypothetical protein
METTVKKSWRLSSLIIITFVVIAISARDSFSVQLDNWRFPYYTLAGRFEAYSPSPSGMFWDDLGYLPDSTSFLDGSFWPDGGRFAENHWTIEPSLSGAARNTNDYFGKNYFLRGTLLNDIRYRGFLTRQVVDVDSRFWDDPQYPWLKNTRGIAARVSEAFLQYGFKYGFLRVGRMYRNWGPFADRSLVLSTNPYSYDGIELGLHSSFFEFRHLFAAFPSQGLSLDMDTVGAGRYFTAHSLNFMLGRFGSIGVTETVVFGRKSGIPDLQYVNPVSIYFITDTDGEGGGNLMEAFQWNLHPFTDKVSIAGQLLIDDIQVDNNAPGDLEPNHWGIDAGVLAHDFLPLSLRHLLSLEYRFVSRWAYTVPDQNTFNGERYTYLGRSLGFPENDGDSINLSFSLAGKNYWLGTVAFSYSRQGQGRIDSLWHTPILGYRTEPHIPSGTVQRTADASLEVYGYFRNFVDARFALHNRWIGNKNNISSPVKYDPSVSFTLSLHYSNFFITLPK